jgi:protein tyrosine kinase modulator
MPATVTHNKIPEGPGLQHYLEILHRRRTLFVIPLFIGWLAIWTASWVLAPKYKSSTLILVEQPTMPKDYVVPNVAENLQERLQSITQQILSRSRLMHIVDELNLYPQDRSRLSPDEIIDRMRNNIEIETVKGADEKITAFNVYYTAGDPATAQKVTSKLTNLFINENLEVRQQESEGNTKFLEDQLAASRKTLEAQEAQIRQFKAQYVGQLPTQTNSNLQILAGLQGQLQAQSEALNTTKQQHVYLETLLSQYRAMRGQTKAADGSLVGVAELDEQLDKLKTELRNLSSTYQEQYPDIRRVKDQIAKVEAQRNQLLAEQKATPKPAAQTDEEASQTAGLKDPSSLAQLQSQLRANQTEIKNREQAIASITAQINGYQSRLNEEPIREQQLADLTRGYDQSKSSYDALLKKKNESAMATSMELLQQGERFRILDPPSLPLKPSFPNRLKFCTIGLAVGLMFGAGVVATAEMMDDRVYDERELRKLLPASVISEVPVIQDAEDERRVNKASWFAWAATAIVAFAIVAGSAVSYLKG